MREASLPKKLRGILRCIRDDSLRLQMVDFIDHEVRFRAEPREAVGEVRGELGPTLGAEDQKLVNDVGRFVEEMWGPGELKWSGRDPAGLRKRADMSGVVYFEALSRMAADPTFLQRLRREVRDALRREHVQGVAPDAVSRITGYVPDVRPKDDRLVVPSDIGLGTASYLEGAPEGWNAWALGEIERRFGPPTSEDDDEDVIVSFDTPKTSSVNVLVVDAGPGGFAKAYYDGATNLPCVVGRDACFLRGGYDCVVSAVPSAASSEAAGHRRIYGASQKLQGSPRPRRWLAELQVRLENFGTYLVPGGVALVLIPLGVRTARGYIQAPELSAEVFEMLQGLAGLRVNDTYVTEEDGPVARPFVGTQRPSLLTVVLEHPKEMAS
jgi:hypothetical protein